MFERAALVFSDDTCLPAGYIPIADLASRARKMNELWVLPISTPFCYEEDPPIRRPVLRQSLHFLVLEMSSLPGYGNPCDLTSVVGMIVEVFAL